MIFHLFYFETNLTLCPLDFLTLYLQNVFLFMDFQSYKNLPGTVRHTTKHCKTKDNICFNQFIIIEQNKDYMLH